MWPPTSIEVQYKCSECTLRLERPFCNMSPTALEALEAIKFTATYPKGSLLFVEGEAPRGVFILCSGQVRLTASSTEGKRLIFSIPRVGDTLGASATILGTPYELSAETGELSQVNFIKREDFLDFLQNHAEARLNTARQLSEKYYAAQRDIRSLGLSQTTSEKLARLLLDWCARSGEETERGTRIKVYLTHEEMAQMIATTRETLTRLFTHFKRTKLIEVIGSTLYVTNKPGLEQMVSI
jgi:CRP/FNR family cyclic AMP-dependent transcriptional regulator